MLWLAIIIAAFIIAMIASYYLGKWVEHNRNEINSLQQRVAHLEEKAEKAPKRMANNTIAGIEDAIAATYDVNNYLQSVNDFLIIMNGRLDNLHTTLTLLRNDPGKYDPDRSVGLRREPRDGG